MDIKTIIIFGLIIGVIILGGYYYFNPNIIIKEIEPKQSILDVEVIGWYENELNSNEMFFSYWVYNYGNYEGKNIKIKCKLYDLNNNLMSSVVDNFGSIASRTYKFGETTTKNIHTNPNEDYIVQCYIEDCDNCKILYQEIPELKKGYENEN